MSKKPTLKDLEQKVAELTEALQRERADAMNIRRRHDEQLRQLKDVVKSGVVKDLLPVIDNLERAVHHRPKEFASNEWAAGVDKISHQLEKVLNDIGVTRISTVGEVFDPNLHEAVSVEGEGGEEIISEELQPGYMLGDQILRHAMVRINKK